jgi:hypothetical protein
MNHNKFSLITSQTSLWTKTVWLALIREHPLKRERSHPAVHECYWPAVLMGQVPKKDWFWDVMPCSLVEVNRCSSETSANVYWTARCHIPEDYSSQALQWEPQIQHSAASRAALRPIQPLSYEYLWRSSFSRQHLKLTTHLYLVLRLRICRAITPLPHASSWYCV